ncbi:MAG TPA: hypothetical protein VG228_09445 [Solirubrobacteraceae bacterium]|jgi:hypothetical protein|nr:hypothetical protein [Solirubrobacteraceae bacterium]
MGLINLEPTLHDGEQVLWRRPAALSLSDHMVAGLLYVTSESLLFMPNRFNRRRDIVSTRIPIGLISSVDTLDPVRSLAAKRNGGMRRRLRVRAGQEALLFVINHPEQVAGELVTALRESPEPA